MGSPNVFHYTGIVCKNMVSVSVRENSFRSCPVEWMDPKKFAVAGFFYIGNCCSPDRLACYSCGIILHMWSPEECPYEEHAAEEQECAHLYLAKGFRFIKEASEGIFCRERHQYQDTDTPGHPKCVICMERDVGCMYLPCYHAASCRLCGATVNNCPICRRKITYVSRLFLP